MSLISLIGIIIGVVVLLVAFLYKKPPVSTYKEWLIAFGIFLIAISLGWISLAIGLFVISIAIFSKHPMVVKYKIWLIILGVIIAIWPFIGTIVFILLLILIAFLIYFLVLRKK